MRVGLFVLVSCFPVFGGQLKFEETVLEVSAKPDADLVEVDFSFEAMGDEAAVIRKYDAPCSCLEAQISENGKLRWEPGETGTVRGLFRVGNFRGTVDKQISLIMEDGETHRLTVRMTMPEFVKVEPKTLRWDVKGPREPQSFSLTIQEDVDLEIVSITGTNEAKFPFELKTVEEGKRYELVVTPTETEVKGFGMLRIATNSPWPKHKTYQAFVVVAQPTGAKK
ncbi:MAG: DUF1573 domain-containing protein [Verrucomicrobiota bacterium]